MPRKPSNAGIQNSDRTLAILTIVRQIPVGRVATYGQIARLAGLPRNARQVGAALRALPTGSGVPWFRVVNSRGEISPRGDGTSQSIQRQALQNENVSFTDQGRIDLSQFGWMTAD